MDVVIIKDRFNFVSDLQDLALIRMEFHLVGSFPVLEGVQVFLENFSILSTLLYIIRVPVRLFVFKKTSEGVRLIPTVRIIGIQATKRF